MAQPLTALIGLLVLVAAACSPPEPAPAPLVQFENLDASAGSLVPRAAPSLSAAHTVANALEPERATRTEPSAAASARPGEQASSSRREVAPSKTLPDNAAENDAVDGAAGPRIAATAIATTIYAKPSTQAERLGYLRLGANVARDPQPVLGSGCAAKWYRVYPTGFVCTDEATIDLQDPLVRAAQVRPDLSRPLPYAYGFVRATAPQYLRVPTQAEQRQAEFKLDEHMLWYRDNRAEIQRVPLGANDVPLDERGYATLGLPGPSGRRLSTQKSITELLGGSSPLGTIPFWLEGSRKVKNVADFKVPDYAVFADRVRRKTGLSFVDAFVSTSEELQRRFAVTVDLRLVPATKIKPDTGSAFHGVEITGSVQLPFAFVSRREATTWKLFKGRDEAGPDQAVPRRAILPLSGKARLKAGQRYYQLARDPHRWVRAADVGVVALPQVWPEDAARGAKWIDISLTQQTLVLYEGQRPVYATLVSTGRDRLGDPKTTLASPQGQFRIRSKHIAAAMDSEENSSVSGGMKTGHSPTFSGDAASTTARLLAAEKAGKKLSEEDQRRLLNVKKGRHPEYGVTMRRGAGDFELRDVPWIQYFAAGYALHGAYWHDVFGVPRSHGCINLSPIDARLVFRWTDPPLPEGWHGMNVSADFAQGTLVSIRE